MARALTLAEQSRNRRRTIQGRQLSQRQGGGFQDIDGILGITGRRGLGNLSAPGSTAGGLAGQQDITIGEEDRNAIQQFFRPSVTGDQQARIEALAKRAAAQGLSGGAPRGQFGDLATRFLAQNRSQAFGRVQEVIAGRVGQIRNDITPFLQQIGTLANPENFSLSGANRASGTTSEQFRAFATPALRALSGIGFGGDAIAGLAQRAGLTLDGQGTTGANDIGDSFARYLSPTDDVAQHGIDAIRRVGSGGFLGGQRQRSIAFAGQRSQARGLERIAAGQTLAGRVGDVFTRLNREATEFSTLGAASNAFAQTGDIGAARKLAGLDFSRFEGIAERLGIGQGVRSGGSQAGFLNRAGLSGNLFNTVFGAGA